MQCFFSDQQGESLTAERFTKFVESAYIHFSKKMSDHFFLGKLIGNDPQFKCDQPGTVEQEPPIKSRIAGMEADEFKERIAGGDGTIEVKKCNPFQSFSFLNMNSGIQPMMSMIHLQNHFT